MALYCVCFNHVNEENILKISLKQFETVVLLGINSALVKSDEPIKEFMQKVISGLRDGNKNLLANEMLFVTEVTPKTLFTATTTNERTNHETENLVLRLLQDDYLSRLADHQQNFPKI